MKLNNSWTAADLSHLLSVDKIKHKFLQQRHKYWKAGKIKKLNNSSTFDEMNSFHIPKHFKTNINEMLGACSIKTWTIQ